MYIFSFALFIHWLAQAVSTQLSPISKLDVFRFATCMSSQQNRKTYIFSWRQAGDMPHACQAYQTSRPGKVCKPSKPSRQARQGRQGRQGRQARQGTSSGNAAIANFKIGRLSVCDMYIFSTGSQHVYPFFGHTNTLTATIGGNAATANFKIGRLSSIRQGKPGRAQAVATQLSPISKLDVCRSATCISSQQDRNMFILSLVIPTH